MVLAIGFLDWLIGIIIGIISFLGYGGIVFLMALESTAVPIPSEAIMPFAGFLVLSGKFDLLLIAIAGAIGSTIGALFSYFIALKYGDLFLKKFGKFFLLDQNHINKTQRFFQKRGALAVFFSRFIPGARHIIGFPAGFARFNLKKFVLLTFAGAFIWCYALAWLGMQLGKNWAQISVFAEPIAVIVISIIIIGLLWWVLKNKKK